MTEVNLIEEVPQHAAPPIQTYPHFVEVEIPPDSRAVRAYRGIIRPFSDDATARRVLRGITANCELAVDGGRLDCDDKDLPAHSMEPYLLDMAEPCTVVVLEHPAPKHHTAYLVDPIQVPHLSSNRHTWVKSTVTIEGKAIPELCVYSGDLFKYDPAYERLPQFLNQLSTYLAKHLIFLRTRMLYRMNKGVPVKQIRGRRPGDPVLRSSLNRGGQLSWLGFWPGKAAPHGADAHIKSVDPDGECWCNSGLIYRACHMDFEKEKVERTNRGAKK